MARIAFFHKDLQERLGVMSIASCLKQHGHDCAVFCGDAEKDIVREIIDFKPDVAASGAMTPEHLYTLEIFQNLKERGKNIMTLMGAHHATIYPEETIHYPQVDVLCLGEGEQPVLELMNNIDSGREIFNIRGLWVKKGKEVIRNPLYDFAQDLDSLPFPDRDLYYSKYEMLAKKPTKPFLISRGCPFQCTFCFNQYYQDNFKKSSPFVNYRTHENIFDEILKVKNNYHLEWVQFHDSTFNSNFKYTKDFLRKYKENNLPGFICNVRVDLLDEEMAGLLKEAGCDKVTLGVESGDDNLRRKVLRKTTTTEQILAATALLKKYGIRMSISNIMGLPGETIEKAFATIELNRKINPEICNCHMLMPFPKTEIAKYCVREGYLDEDFSLSRIIGPNQNKALLKQENINELANLQKFFYYAVKYPRLVPLIKLLIKLRPNKLFVLAKNYPLLKRSLKYEKRWQAKLNFIKKWLAGSDI